MLVDQIYRTRDNREYCKNHGIEISGPKLGRPSKENKKATKEEYQDNTDRIEVERFFSRDKHSFGAGLIMTKLGGTTMTSVALSVLAANVFKADVSNFFVLYFKDTEECDTRWYFMEFEPAA